ncbi:conserved hypothetical protein [Haliangium ochraceum DSM 14365]|uniref:Uncharacterized protein n=1 Tax=Haliangium ochraceum (strain DSM 14365 / JCM 11303 / SMP-2) TaxID=502025 RepID=D0LG01_HALO1|nr:conserved hypothetical protein [Haliangium ochraceum DSM 14365]
MCAAALLLGCSGEVSVSRDLGASCSLHAECGERCLRDDAAPSRYPDGFCSASCDSERDCPAGAVCADVEGGVCLFACDDSESCAFLGAGWACVSESALRRGAGTASQDPAAPPQVKVCLGR